MFTPLVTILVATIAATCDDVVTFADGLEPSAEIHVATDGSNAAGNGSASDPYATIAFAATQATPGTSIVVHPGVYGGGQFVVDLHGTADAPIWIGGVPGAPRPVLDGSGEGLHLVRGRYLVVHDLEVRNAANNGINADDGGDVADPLATHHLVFERLFIHDIGGTGNQDGLKLSGLNDYWVRDCEITACGGNGSGSAIDHVGCHHGVIVGCHLHDLSGNAVQCKGGSEDIEIRRCRITEAGHRAVNMGGSTGFQFFRPPLSPDEPNVEARDIRVVANVIEGTNASIAFVGCVDSVAAGNTIVDPHNWILRILQETTSTPEYEFLPCSNNRFENNLVYFDDSDLSTYVNIGPNTAPGTFTFTSSLWYAHDDPSASTPTLPVRETGGIYGVDPLLASPADGRFGISTSSPAAGTAIAPPIVAADYPGRCYATPPSIGAFEVPTADLDGNGAVDGADLGLLLASWGPCVNCLADLDLDGAVSGSDLGILLGAWTSR